MSQSQISHDVRKQLCAVAPSPQLRERIQQQLNALRAKTAELSAMTNLLSFRLPVRAGMNDGIVRPTDYMPAGVGAKMIMSTPAERTPLRGQLRVAVVLVEFQDKKLQVNKNHIHDLFFSKGKIPTGSVTEYYKEVTNSLVDIVGDVVGPIALPHPITYYANGQSGMGDNQPNAQTMALDAAKAADPSIDFTPYDNDGDGFVDAFVIVHAGQGAEETGSGQDIWSHKWVLAGGEYNADSTKIYAYLTVPEDCKLGVCAHELGHLLFGFPDLYDTDYSSEGIGNWCLMSGGSWNGNGDVPAHPSAWCKANQSWATVTHQAAGQAQVSLDDVKAGTGVILHVAPPNANVNEYRQRTDFDQDLPGDGLLVWHIDDRVAENSNENHPKVALVQADNRRDLEHATNRGDDGDPYPGSTHNTALGKATKPNSHLYTHGNSHVEISNISASAPTMTFDLDTRVHVAVHKPKKAKAAARESAA